MDTENLPAIGTPEAAVHAVESLIHRGDLPQLEPLQLRYWLDAYYQARRAAECARTAAERCSALREDDAETQQTADATSSVTVETVTPSPQGEGKPRKRPVGWDDGKPQEGDHFRSPTKEAAAFKRQQHERLQQALRNGVTMRQIVQAAEGEINEDQTLGIRECKRVPVETYRILAAALDRIETD